jgi:hypothetical protein
MIKKDTVPSGVMVLTKGILYVTGLDDPPDTHFICTPPPPPPPPPPVICQTTGPQPLPKRFLHLE